MPKPRNKPGTRSVEKKLLVFCEGAKDKSENAYFKAFIKDCRFAGNRVDVKVIDTEKNTGRELVLEALSYREIKEDILWVVYDKDGYTKHPETFSEARNKNVKIAFSAISFEYWILLHFTYITKPFRKSDEIIDYLMKNFDFHYGKGSSTIYSLTKDSIEKKAKVHALRLQNFNRESYPDGTPVYEFDSYTNINELIDEIKSLEVKK